MGCPVRGPPLAMPITTTMTHMTRIMIPSLLPKISSFLCSGVGSSSAFWTTFAIFPISVFIPVSTTTPMPLPYVTSVPVKARFFLSASGTSSTTLVPLETGTDSPVRIASSIFNSDSFIILMSAGTLLPPSRRIISPGTRNSLAILLSFPSRITTASGDVNFLRASIVFSALYSCTKPKIAFKITITIIAKASITSPMRAEKTVAAISMIIKKLLNWEIKISILLIPFSFFISLYPYSSSLDFVSSSLRPFSELRNLFNASFASSSCQFVPFALIPENVSMIINCLFLLKSQK